MAALSLFGSKAHADEPDADEEPQVRQGSDWLAIPLLEFNDDEGLVYGVKVELIDFGQNEKPYAWYAEAKLQHSTTNRHQHRLLFDFPRAWSTRWRLTIRAEFLHIADANYFGAGNRSPGVGARGERFHQYRLTEPRLTAQARYVWNNGFFIGTGLTGNVTLIDVPDGRLLALQAPRGLNGGVGLAMVATAGFDNRDNELVPHRGIYAEVYARGAPETVGNTFGTATMGTIAQGYFDPLSWLVLAQRFMLERSVGDVPFYEMGHMGSLHIFPALGGVFSQRGFLENRFIGRGRFLSNTEARVYFPPLWDHLHTGLVAFTDVSRVVEDDGQSFIDGLHPSYGGGVSINWKYAFLFRMDYGVSEEGGLFYIEGRHMF